MCNNISVIEKFGNISAETSLVYIPIIRKSKSLLSAKMGVPLWYGDEIDDNIAIEGLLQRK